MNSDRDQEQKKAISSYYEPYMNSIYDTLDLYNIEIQQAAIDKMKLHMPPDTSFNGINYKIEKDIWPSKKIVFLYDKKKYLELSLQVFEDINAKFKGAAPQDFDRFIDVSKRVRELFQGELRAKILLTDTVKKIPTIYEIIDDNENSIIKDNNAFDRLKTHQFEGTDFMIWYLQDGFLTTSFFILLFMTFAYFKKR